MNFEEIKAIRERFLANSFSSDIFDAMDKLGYSNQALDHQIVPLKDDWKICGPAVTISGNREPVPPAEFLAREGHDKRFWIYDSMYPGCVVCLSADGDRVTGHWGELMSYGARNLGVSGVVIDGGTRDKTGIIAIGDFTCFARYTTAVESANRWRPKYTQVPISMAGTLTAYVRVNPGDWIFGDNDNVIVIPQEILMEVLAKVEDISRKENLSRKAFAEGQHIAEVFEIFERD